MTDLLKTRALPAVLVLGWLLFATFPAQAASYVVPGGAQPGDANSLAGYLTSGNIQSNDILYLQGNDSSLKQHNWFASGSKTLTIESNAPGTLRTLFQYDAQNPSPSGGIFRSTSTPVVSTLIFKDIFISNSSANWGGALYFNGPLTVSGAIISGSQVTYQGGAIHGGREVEIINSTLTHNRADYGGAAYSATTMTIDGGAYEYNSASYGGALFANQGTTIKNNASFNYNQSTSTGGAVQGYGTVDLADAQFARNSSQSSGGAVYSAKAFNARQVSFTGNSARSAGGAIFASDALTISGNSTFSGNSAGLGGAIYAAANNNPTISLNPASGEDIVFFDNKAGASLNSIHFGATNNVTGRTTAFVLPGAGQVIMRDPISSSEAITLNVDKTGSGHWYLGGTSNIPSASTWNISSGALQLIHDYQGNPAVINLSHSSTADFNLGPQAALLVTLPEENQPHRISANNITLDGQVELAGSRGANFAYGPVAVPQNSAYTILEVRAATSLINRTVTARQVGRVLVGPYEYEYSGVSWVVVDPGKAEDLVATIDGADPDPDPNPDPDPDPDPGPDPTPDPGPAPNPEPSPPKPVPPAPDPTPDPPKPPVYNRERGGSSATTAALAMAVQNPLERQVRLRTAGNFSPGSLRTGPSQGQTLAQTLLSSERIRPGYVLDMNASPWPQPGADYADSEPLWLESPGGGGDLRLGNLGLWANPGYAYTDASSPSDYKIRTPSIAAGIEFFLNNDSFIGFALAGAFPEYESGQADTDAKNLTGLLYGGVRLPWQAELALFAGYGHTSYEQTRRAFGQSYDSDYDSDNYHLGLNLGRRFGLNDAFALRPFISYEYMHLKVDDYADGTGLHSLHFDSRRHETHFLRTGLDLTWTLASGLYVTGRAYYAGLYGDRRAEADAHFTQDPARNVFTSLGDDLDRHSLGLGCSAAWALSANFELSLGYNFLAGADASTHQANVELLFRF